MLSEKSQEVKPALSFKTFEELFILSLKRETAAPEEIEVKSVLLKVKSDVVSVFEAMLDC